MKLIKAGITLFSMLLLFSVNAQKNNSKPNIIVVLADDVGAADISHYRNLQKQRIIVETPNIDNLASQGIYFTAAHAPAALCATSRYSIMTGSSCYRSPLPWGVWSGYAPSVISKKQLTLGRLMKQADYNTAFLGKWHLGTSFAKKSNPNEIFKETRNKVSLNIDITKIVDGGPAQNGFDYSFTLPSGIQNVPYAMYEQDKWYPFKKNSEIAIIDDVYMKSIGATLEKKVGLGDSNWQPSEVGPVLANKAIDYISKNAHKEKPFFMYYCSQAVHTPHLAPKELNGVKIAGTTPSKHLDMVKELDVQVGMMIEELKKQGIYENTVFIFTSDNGGLHVDGDTWNAHHDSSGIYRGCKNDPYEGGHRVPFIVVWPNKIKENKAVSEPVLGLDILATIAAISNQKIGNNVAMDSNNLLPVLLGKQTKTKRSNILVQGGSHKEVIIIDGDWKLIIQIDKKDRTNKKRTPVALFNLKDNIRETEMFNFIDNPKYKKKVIELFNKYNKTRDSKIQTGYHF